RCAPSRGWRRSGGWPLWPSPGRRGASTCPRRTDGTLTAPPATPPGSCWTSTPACSPSPRSPRRGSSGTPGATSTTACGICPRRTRPAASPRGSGWSTPCSARAPSWRWIWTGGPTPSSSTPWRPPGRSPSGPVWTACPQNKIAKKTAVVVNHGGPFYTVQKPAQRPPLVHQVLLRLGVKQVDQLRTEGEVDVGAVGDAAAVLGGQLHGGDAQHHVPAHGVDMEVHLAAHHLGHVHLAGDGVASGGGGKGDVLGADAHHHGL